jgi:probable rRNA maturation factor
MEKIKFYNADRKFVFPGKGKLKLFINEVFKKEKIGLSSINYVFCSDEYLLKINQDFLQHDYYTDVITFDLSEPHSSEIDAEVYISLDRIEENVKKISSTKKKEILRVIFHAALHLCGYNDKKKSEIIKMREKEEQYLRLYGKQQSKQ